MLDQDTTDISRADILKVVLIYAIFGSLWILFSDKAVEWMFDTRELLMIAQTVKGWLFVVATSFLLYFLLRRIFVRQGKGKAPAPSVGIVSWKRWQLYLFAAAVTLATVLIRENLSVSFGARPLLIMFMFPIILSAALGGFGPGMLATLIATLYALFSFNTTNGAFPFDQPQELLPLGFMATEGLLVSLLSKMLHEARFRSELERQNAETRLAEKTQALQLLDGISSGATDAIFAKDVDDRFILFNPACEYTTGEKSGRGARPRRARDLSSEDRREGHRRQPPSHGREQNDHLPG